MVSEQGQLHIFFLPFMAQGHVIPMIDTARLFATPSSLFAETISRDNQNLGIQINLQTVKFSAKEAGLPEGYNLLMHQTPKNISSSHSDTFVVPGNLPHEIKLMISELSPFDKGACSKAFLDLRNEIIEAKRSCHGSIINSFYELEPSYVDYFEKELGFKHWHIGPLALYFKDQIRGKKSSIDLEGCLKWLDEKEANSVIYICFGSFSDVSDAQLHEIALALEALGQNFILVVRKDSDNWMPQGFKERVKEQGLIIRGWAPQVLILNHRAVGGFVTHCGWNSVLEGVTAGVPMVTWPLHAEQFYSEKLVTQVLRIGIQVGAKKWVARFEDQNILISRETILMAMRGVMVGEEAQDMRNRAVELKEMAKRAVSEGGSSSSALNNLIAEIKSYKI
ncbi:hypothetical protein Cgig2_032634 [Carnegiea gigantea]|uniref:Glycosyltransferase n=1 Tax=Carnegiea gigantea TaxID=171969 RepID=A0A9Q1KWL2_9CARY|nr:hypothetical protein Cgig2_032634 [Carnegiea gigantea]